jgi:ubiquinone/menaquinone biosynthesis C-methylase UbiE
MLDKARSGLTQTGMTQVQFKEGLAESLPVPDGWADVVISNGVLNLCPDKVAALREMHRVLKPNGRLQIGDILVQKAVPDSAKRNITSGVLASLKQS